MRTDPDIFRYAAELLDAGQISSGCCKALSVALDCQNLGDSTNFRYTMLLEEYFRENDKAWYFGACQALNDALDDPPEAVLDALNHRIYALLFLAAMLESP